MTRFWFPARPNGQRQRKIVVFPRALRADLISSNSRTSVPKRLPDLDQLLKLGCLFIFIEDLTRFLRIERRIGVRLQILPSCKASVSSESLGTSPNQKFQITTDGFAPYRAAIVDTLSGRITGFAQLIKVYGQPSEGEARYSAAEVVDTEVVPVFGDPDPKRICTSSWSAKISPSECRCAAYAPYERFSKKWDNLWSAYCLHFAYYNFCRIHKTLRVTPAMEAGIANHVWSWARVPRCV